MDNPNVALLCLEQRDRSLETHTRDFLELACLTHYPDRSLCVFYIFSLSEWSKARLPGKGPWDNFAACVEWVLENNGLYFSICPAEDISSPTPKPVTSQPSSLCTEISPEPTPDGEPEPAVTRKSEPHELSRESVLSERPRVLVPSSLPSPPLAPPSSPSSPLVPSSSSSSPLAPSSSPSSPLTPSSLALPERPRESALPERPRESIPESPVPPWPPEAPDPTWPPEFPDPPWPPESPDPPWLPEAPDPP